MIIEPAATAAERSPANLRAQRQWPPARQRATPWIKVKKAARGLAELILHPAERRMLPVLDLDPMVAPARSVDALAMLGYQPLQPHAAGGLKQPPGRSRPARTPRLTMFDFA
jgi:hypothetical protein